MFFKGWEKVSLIEWPGRICSVVFIGGCNFSCPWCYNRDLVKNPEKLPDIDEKEVLEYLSKNKKMFDGVMITGGEPTILFEAQGAKATEREDKIARPPNPTVGGEGGQLHDLISFVKRVKDLGLGVGIETNGTNPEAIEFLIDNKLVDYLAMDIKAPILFEPALSRRGNKIERPPNPTVGGEGGLPKSKYDILTGTRVDLKKIKKSIELIKNAGLDYEFRTTVVTDLLNEDDILEIAKYLKGAKRYYLQQYRPEKNGPKKAYPKIFFEDLRQKIKDYFEIFEIRL
jgi:pyruvate formate lyase activating enzyme